MGNGTGKPLKSDGSGSRSSSSKKKKTGRLGPAGGGQRSTLGKNPNGTPARASSRPSTATPGSPSSTNAEKERERDDHPLSSSPTGTSRTLHSSGTPRASSNTARSTVASPRTAQATPRDAASIAASPAASVQGTPRTARTPHGHAQHPSNGYRDEMLAPLQEQHEFDPIPEDHDVGLEPALHPAFANPAFTAEDHYPLVAPTGAYLQEEPGYPADRGPMSWPPSLEQLDPLASWPPAMTYAACIPATPYRVSAGGMPQSPLPSVAGVEPATYDPFAGLPSGSGTFGNPSHPLTHFQAAANAQVYVNPTSVVWGKQVIPPPEYLRELEQQNIVLWSTQKQLSKILMDDESQKWLKLLQVSLMTVLKLNPVQQLTARARDAQFTEEDVWRETEHFQSGASAVTAQEYLHNMERQNRLLWETQALVSSIFTNPDTISWTKKGQAAISTILNLNRIEKLVMKARSPEQVRDDEMRELDNANPFAQQQQQQQQQKGARFPQSTLDHLYPGSGLEGDGYGGGLGGDSFDFEEKSYDAQPPVFTRDRGRSEDAASDGWRSTTPQQMTNQAPNWSSTSGGGVSGGGGHLQSGAVLSPSGLPVRQTRQRGQSMDMTAAASAPSGSTAARRHARGVSTSNHRMFLDAHALASDPAAPAYAGGARSDSTVPLEEEADQLESLQIGDRDDEEQLATIVRDAVIQATPRGRADTPEEEPLPDQPHEDAHAPMHQPRAFKPLAGSPNAVRVHDDDGSVARGGGGGHSKSATVAAGAGLDTDQLYVYMDEEADPAAGSHPVADSHGSSRARPRFGKPDALHRSAVAPVAIGGAVEALPGARQRRAPGAIRSSPKGSGDEEEGGDGAGGEEEQQSLTSPLKKPLASPGPKRKPPAAMSAATQALILKQLAMKAGRQK